MNAWVDRRGPNSVGLRAVHRGWWALSCALGALTVAGCFATTGAETAALREIGVRTRPATGSGWFVFEADEGYQLTMPAVPRARAEEYVFGRTTVPARFFDLEAEQRSRGYLARVFDARALDDDRRERVRAQGVERFLPSDASIAQRRTVVQDGQDVEELVVEGYSIHGHIGLVRSFVRDGFVWVLLVISAPGSGHPSDAERFFQGAR